MPTYTYQGVTVRSNTDLTPEELDQAFSSYKGGADTAGHGNTVTRMESAVDRPLENAYNPVEDLATLGGATAGAGIMKGLSQVARRARPGTIGIGSDIVGAVGRTAPKALKPAGDTAEALSNVMRLGGGRKALSQSRETGLGGIYNELVQAQNAAPSMVPGRPDRFKQLVTELADANRAAFNPVTAEARSGQLSLVPLRERGAILNDLKQELTPDQFARFQALQDEYSQGSSLLRLFKAPKGESGSDVLANRGALQRRAIGMQDKLDPELLRKILPGGPLQTDKALPANFGIPLLNTFSPVPIPGGTWGAAGPSTLEDILTMLGGIGGGGLSRYLYNQEPQR